MGAQATGAVITQKNQGDPINLPARQLGGTLPLLFPAWFPVIRGLKRSDVA